jgi:hypothetical protein
MNMCYQCLYFVLYAPTFVQYADAIVWTFVTLDLKFKYNVQPVITDIKFAQQLPSTIFESRDDYLFRRWTCTSRPTGGWDLLVRVVYICGNTNIVTELAWYSEYTTERSCLHSQPTCVLKSFVLTFGDESEDRCVQRVSFQWKKRERLSMGFR